MTPHHMRLVCGEQALITLGTSECFATKTFVTDLVTRMCLTCNRVWVGNGKGRFFLQKVCLFIITLGTVYLSISI